MCRLFWDQGLELIGEREWHQFTWSRGVEFSKSGVLRQNWMGARMRFMKRFEDCVDNDVNVVVVRICWQASRGNNTMMSTRSLIHKHIAKSDVRTVVRYMR